MHHFHSKWGDTLSPGGDGEEGLVGRTINDGDKRREDGDAPRTPPAFGDHTNTLQAQGNTPFIKAGS